MTEKNRPIDEALLAKCVAMNRVIDGLTDRPDRELAIIAGSMIEELLIDVIGGALVDSSNEVSKALFSGPAAILGTFASRIWLARAFGLISERVAKDLIAIKDIRNLFAHHYDDISFSAGQSGGTKQQISVNKALASLTITEASDFQDPTVFASGSVDTKEMYTLCDDRPECMIIDAENHILASVPRLDKDRYSEGRMRFAWSAQIIWLILVSAVLSSTAVP